MAPINAVATGAWTIQSTNNARQGRALMQSFFANNDASPMNGTRSGVILTTGLTIMSDLLVQVFSGLQLSVAPGSGMVYRSGQGPYLGWLTGSSVLVTCDTAPVSNPRNDIVVMRVYDAAVGDTVPPSGGPCQIEVITGTPAASPVDPVTPNSVGVITTGLGSGGGVAIPLARAQVSTAGVITLTDLRRSTAIPGTVRVLMPGDSDTNGRVGDLRWNGSGLDIKDQAGNWQSVAIGNSVPRGFVVSHKPTSSVTSAGTTETVACVAQWTAVAGRRYKATWQGDLSSTSSTTGSGFRLRYKQTSSTTDVTGTIISARDVVTNVTTNTSCNGFGDFVAASSATYTVVATIYATNGAGNCIQAYNATGHIPNLTIEDIGT
jgi:hypothetical protein